MSTSPISGIKFDSAKNRLDLIHPWFTKHLGWVLTKGAQKYAPDNWKKVKHGRRRYYAAIQRHLTARVEGEIEDPEWGLPHLMHAACCLMFLYGYDVLKIKDEEEPCGDAMCDLCYPPKPNEAQAASFERRQIKRVKN